MSDDKQKNIEKKSFSRRFFDELSRKSLKYPEPVAPIERPEVAKIVIKPPTKKEG